MKIRLRIRIKKTIKKGNYQARKSNHEKSRTENRHRLSNREY